MAIRFAHRVYYSRLAACGLAIMLMLAALDAPAAQWYVQLGGSTVAFSPQFLTITAGDTVTYFNVGGYHNVVADDGSFRCAHGCDDDGQGGNGNASDTWLVTVAFPTAGTVGYFCEPHGSPGAGMYGIIDVIAAPASATLEPAPTGSPPLQLALAAAIGALALVRLRRFKTARSRQTPRR